MASKNRLDNMDTGKRGANVGMGNDTDGTERGVRVEPPGSECLQLRTLLLDFTGTLSKDGQLLDGVGERLRLLHEKLDIIVMSADTFGRARTATAELPLDLRIIQTGQDKAACVRDLGSSSVVVIGNGRNDVPMFECAGLAIAVIGPEGVCADLLARADVVVNSINDGLDLLLHPLRLKATLRA